MRVTDRRTRRRPVQPAGLPSDGTEALLGSRTEPGHFGDFFDRHYGDLLAYFAARVRSPETAADLCAETFAAALAGVGRFDPARGTASQWLYGIARNLLHHYWRDLRVRRNARDDLGMASVEVDGDTAAMIARVDAQARGFALHGALDRLANGHRRAVELRVLAELDYSEIAAELGCRPGTARVRVHRGLRQLRDAMEADDVG